MKANKSLRSWENYLRSRHSPETQYFRLKNEIALIDERVRNARSIRVPSPNSWAVSANICAIALYKFVKSYDSDKLAHRFQCTPNRLIRLMAACAVNAKIGAARYRVQGIDPQAKVTIDPHLERCRDALEQWRKREARHESKQTES